ncbi:GNAT family N-acetyltransferase [Actinoplanes sp. TBRC 11911]|uniref:GNAT family N-acetyltransferase n=1 Tax=Actinoplanes sp. TBRC 11911 TaxID=2729386 RepID=UPI00145E07E3|nr:GNAT family protein [Actinoplanes sp. TBRC 11911]NMO51885.1 GNAT family N-acetyltransferase [Actinoplanes sp. TBRC 11911]
MNPLESDRIALRPIEKDDLTQLVTWFQDPEVLRFQSSGPFIPRSVSALAEEYSSASGRRDTDVWLAVFSKSEEKVIGTVALQGGGGFNRTATFILMIGPPYQDRGYGLAATRLTLSYGFSQLGLHRIQLVVFGFNERAMKTYKNAGFVEEGRARDSLFRDGRFHDVVHMGILDEEWRALSASRAG